VQLGPSQSAADSILTIENLVVAWRSVVLWGLRLLGGLREPRCLEGRHSAVGPKSSDLVPT
jgi:hypothetical protein